MIPPPRLLCPTQLQRNCQTQMALLQPLTPLSKQPLINHQSPHGVLTASTQPTLRSTTSTRTTALVLVPMFTSLILASFPVTQTLQVESLPDTPQSLMAMAPKTATATAHTLQELLQAPTTASQSQLVLSLFASSIAQVQVLPPALSRASTG